MSPRPPLPPDEPKRCHPCRGTGEVISTQGGETRRVTCPWCEGGGRRLQGHDAQAVRRAEPAPASS